jgi:hypothetical protein
VFKRNQLTVYDLPSGALRAILPFPGDVYTAAFSEDATMLLGGSRERRSCCGHCARSMHHP